jgi:hypothetical protein
MNPFRRRVGVLPFDIRERFAIVAAPANVGQMNTDHGIRKLDRHALSDRAATIAAGDHIFCVSQHIGHQSMQPLRGCLDARDYFRGAQLPGERKAWQRGHDDVAGGLFHILVVGADQGRNDFAIA